MLLVTGGYDDDDEDLISTEIQRTRDEEWKVVENFPLKLHGLRGTNLDGVIFMTGKT